MKIHFQYSGEKSIHTPHTTFNTLETTLFGLTGTIPTFYQVSTSFSNLKKCHGEIRISTAEIPNINAQTRRRIETPADPQALLRTHFSIVEYLRIGILPEDVDLSRILNDPKYRIE